MTEQLDKENLRVDDVTANAKKAELDRALTNPGSNVGIAFGLALFNEFHRRGWFSLEMFGALGTTLFEMELPAYGRTHHVFQTWGVPDLEFRIGKDASRT